MRTPEERLQTSKRWVWVLVVILGGLVGAVVYLAVGRRPPPAGDPVRTGEERGPTPDRGRRAAELLYGDPGERSGQDDREKRT